MLKMLKILLLFTLLCSYNKRTDEGFKPLNPSANLRDLFAKSSHYPLLLTFSRSTDIDFEIYPAPNLLINYQEEQTYENFLLTSPIEEANLIKIAKILTDCTGYLQVILYKGYVRYIKIAPETYDVSIFKEIVLFKKNKALVVNNFVFDSIPDFSDTEIQYFDLSFTRIKQTFDFAKFPKELELLELFNTGITSFQNCDKVKKIANLVIALNNTADIGCSSDKINFCVGCYPFEMTWQIFDGDKKLRKKKEKEFYEFVRKSPKRLNYPMLP